MAIFSTISLPSRSLAAPMRGKSLTKNRRQNPLGGYLDPGSATPMCGRAMAEGFQINRGFNVEDPSAIALPHASKSILGINVCSGGSFPSGTPEECAPSIRFPTYRLRFVADTRGAQIFIHDEKGAQAMKIIHVPLAGQVVGEVADISAFTNVDQVRHAISVL